MQKMKTIKKLKLINWHSFDNEEFEFSTVNVITGENGTGKSTILDAVHYLQSGGTCKFNSAANSLSSGRTVENYLKARIGGEGVEFLRDTNDIIGHIAIEYFDTNTRKPYVLGCVLQLVDGRLNQPIFYQIRGKTWNDQLFFAKDEVRNYDELEKEAKAEGLDISVIGLKRQSDKARRRLVLQALGVPEKYEVLFSKALSFEPLQDISRFATDFLLPESELDLTSIKDSMDGYREIQEQVAIEQRRAEELKPIAENRSKYEELLKKEFALNLLLIDSNIEIAEKDIQKDESQIIIQKGLSDKHDREYKEEWKKENECRRRAEEIIGSDAYKEIKKLKERQSTLNADLIKLKTDIKNWESEVLAESSLARKMDLSLDLSNVLEKKNYQQYVSVLSAYMQRIEEKNKEIDGKKIDVASLRKEKVARKQIVDNELKELRANSYAFPDYVCDLMNSIKEAVEKAEGNSSSLNISCLSALCQINDKAWTNAIEGLLGNRRFDLFVNGKYRNIAKNIFLSKPELKDFFGVGVVECDGEINKPQVNSLALKIDSFRIDKTTGKTFELKESRKYLDFLLGDIICVDSISDFVPGQKAITKEGAFFDGESIRYVSLEAMEKPYIGQESIKSRLEKAEAESKHLAKEISDFDKDINSYDLILGAIRRSRASELLNKKNLWSEEATISKNLSDTIRDIKELEKINGDIIQLNELIDKFNADADEAKENARRASEAKSAADQEIGRLKDDIEKKKKAIEDYNKEKKDLLDNCKLDIGDLADVLKELRQNKQAKELHDFVWNQKGPVAQSKTAVENTIKNAMSLYCNNHPGEMVNDISTYMLYVQRYNKIVDDDLAKLNPELDAARIRSEEELREHFISRIRASLESARKDINSLNSALRKHPFGSDLEIFEFVGNKSKDKLLGSIYRIAMETSQDTVDNSLFAESLDPQSRDAMEQVFKILSTNEDDPEYRDIRNEIVDYRNYLNYDIRIDINNGENVLLYSKNQDSKSGGETQTPFYALIAGAFQSILSKNERDLKSPTNLVVFDEAFNNMDGERIRQMLEFYKELNIQLIISVPSSRFSYISPHADNIISLAKSGYSVAVFQTIKR